MRVVVTGGSGFIGRQVVLALTARGDDVVVLDLERHSDPDVACVVGDVRDADAVGRALAGGAEGVVHLAARTSVLESVKDPDGVFQTNVVGTQQVLEACRREDVGTFVLASTNAVVGDVGDRLINEKTDLRPLTAYGATKAAGEMLMSSYAASYGMHTVALRFTNVYGTGMQTKDSVVARLMKAALGGPAVPVYGSGEQVRDYLFVADAVAAVELALGLGRADVLTIGAGRSVTMKELHALAEEATGAPIALHPVPAKPGEMPAVVVDPSYAASVGFVLGYDLLDGLRATWEDFKAFPPAL
jgi:UDP-glucose 4-epimerase